jgi:hypothetical protein
MTVPGYWMNETSGKLRPVVEKYLRGESLTIYELNAIRAYIRQWMRGDFHGPEVEQLRARVDGIVTTAALTSWLDDAADAGVDPL